MATTHPRENIILVGFMGSGKSSIGKQVARQMSFDFLDTDQLIVQAAGREIPEIFENDGEAAFRCLETKALQSIASRERCVVATGGGLVLREENRSLLRQLGWVVALVADEEVIFARVCRNSKRPLLQTENPRQTLHALLEARGAVYREAADFVLDTSALSHTAAVREIVSQARSVFPSENS